MVKLYIECLGRWLRVQSKSCPNPIKELEKYEFKINWTLLKIGYEGQQFLPKLISSDAIFQYAEELIETMESGYELISLLISPEDEMEFSDVLENLARAENVEQSIQQRKLRVYVVQETLKELPEDYFKGLIELASLWGSLGFPHDSPHEFHGQNNLYTPQGYYTQDVFNSLLTKHKQWIKNEIEHIKLLEK